MDERVEAYRNEGTEGQKGEGMKVWMDGASPVPILSPQLPSAYSNHQRGPQITAPSRSYNFQKVQISGDTFNANRADGNTADGLYERV